MSSGIACPTPGAAQENKESRIVGSKLNYQLLVFTLLQMFHSNSCQCFPFVKQDHQLHKTLELNRGRMGWEHSAAYEQHPF